MGASHSVQPDPIPDPNIFINIGCVGLDSSGFNGNRLSSAPFLSVNFQANDYNTMINNIIKTLEQIKPGWSPTPIRPEYNFDLSGDLNSSINKNTEKTNNPNNTTKPITITTPNGTSYKLYNGYNESLDMQTRLKILAEILNSEYDKYTHNTNNPVSPNSIWAQQGGSLNGQTMAYWETKFVYGPVYLLVAQDEDTKLLDCYMYFPSMTKDSRLWPNANYLGLAHNWMYILLFGTGSRIQWCRSNDAFPGLFKFSTNDDSVNTKAPGFPGGPNPCMNGYTRCKQTFKEMPYWDRYNWVGWYKNTYFYPTQQPIENRFMFGCKTTNPNNPYACQQSKEAHQGMGIYDDHKSADEYPIAYYHAYSFRFSDSRINSFINDGPYSLQYLTQSMYRGVSCGLAQNILPAYTKMMQGCTTGLVSQNNRFFLVLGGYNLTLYENLYDRNLSMNCVNNSFSGLNIIFNIRFDGGFKSYLIIEDNLINIYSATTSTNTVMLVKSIPFIQKAEFTEQYTLVLNNTGLLQVININNTVIGSLDAETLNNGNIITPYDKNADYARRLLNLKNYLIFRNIYIDVDINPKDSNNKSKQKIIIPPFNSNTNYIQRMIELLEYLEKQNKVDKNTVNNFRINVISQTGMDINGLVPDVSQNSSLSASLSQNSQQLSSDQLGSDSGTAPSQSEYADSIHATETKRREAEQAEYDSKINNEANPTLKTCPKPACIGQNCPPPKTSTTYTSKNEAPSLSSLQDIAGTNNIFNADSETSTGIFNLDNENESEPRILSKRETYIAERLAALKAYLEIKNNMN